MQKDRGGRILAIVAICIAVCGLSVAYAALSSTLQINGTATVTPATWGVEFDPTTLSAPVLTGAASVTTAPNITATKIDGYNLTLTKPGDSVTYTFNVKNTGTIDAKITDFTYLTPTYTPNNTDTAAADKTLVQTT